MLKKEIFRLYATVYSCTSFQFVELIRFHGAKFMRIDEIHDVVEPETDFIVFDFFFFFFNKLGVLSFKRLVQIVHRTKCRMQYTFAGSEATW